MLFGVSELPQCMHVFRILMVVSLLSLGAWADDGAKLALEVQQIFKAKCADCHGAHMPKPKGKFGYVLDLARVGKNPDYVKPGDAEGSEIYQMVLHNEMPGEDADVPPLTPDEVKKVGEWIKAGSPGVPELSSPSAVVSEVPVEKVERPFFSRLLAWVSNFHPASTHFPIAMLLGAVLAEGIAWFTRRESWLLVVRFLVVVGAITAPGVAALGWLNAKYGNFTSTIAEIHRWTGVSTAVWAIVCAILVCSSECAEGSRERARFRGALLFGALLVSVTGFLGGLLTFGTDHYKW
jgi:uncharacterized membrane protein